ncbi:BREX protein BrxB domain-containing protein, partial [Cetobacterium sp.]
PIVRTHTVLNNLQNIFDHTKVLLFFPGEYTSVDLRLFGFKDNNYYRAFRI